MIIFISGKEKVSNLVNLEKNCSLVNNVGMIKTKDEGIFNYKVNLLHLLIGHQIWRPPSLSKLTLMEFNTGLTRSGSKASKYNLHLHSKLDAFWLKNHSLTGLIFLSFNSL